jgi:chaperonin GroES
MNLKPLGDRVLVKRSEEGDQKSAGGIIIPDTAKEKPQRGKVVAAGPGALKEDGTRTPLEVKKGDDILFGKYSGTEVKLDNEEYLIMHESDILGILTK